MNLLFGVDDIFHDEKKQREYDTKQQLAVPPNDTSAMDKIQRSKEIA